MSATPDMTRQVETVRISVSDVIGANSFADGYNEVRNGQPFDYEKASASEKEDEKPGEGAWGYERGRAVALYALDHDGKIPPLYVDRGKGLELNRRVETLVLAMHAAEGLFL